MKTYTLTLAADLKRPYLAFASLCLLSACALVTGKPTDTAKVTDANDVVHVAQAFSDSLFQAETPAITTAVAHLPPETQALAQAAYVALQRGIDEALAKGVNNLSTTDKVKAQAALNALGEASDKLSAALHTANDPVLTSEPDLVQPTMPGAAINPGINVKLP